MCLDPLIIENNEVILITNNKKTNKLTIDLLNKWTKNNSQTKLKIIDLDKNTINTCIRNMPVKIENNKEVIEDFIQENNVFSYPSILVLRKGILIEQIFGSYNNILEIVDFYI